MDWPMPMKAPTVYTAIRMHDLIDKSTYCRDTANTLEKSLARGPGPVRSDQVAAPNLILSRR